MWRESCIMFGKVMLGCSVFMVLMVALVWASWIGAEQQSAQRPKQPVQSVQVASNCAPQDVATTAGGK